MRKKLSRKKSEPKERSIALSIHNAVKSRLERKETELLDAQRLIASLIIGSGGSITIKENELSKVMFKSWAIMRIDNTDGSITFQIESRDA